MWLDDSCFHHRVLTYVLILKWQSQLMDQSGSCMQCFGSVLNSIPIRIRIQHFRSIQIRILIRIQVFSGQKERKNFRKIKIFFSVTNCYKDNDWGLPSSSKAHQPFRKMVKALFTLKSQFYFPFWTPFWLSWIRIRIPNTDPDPGEPFQYGSTWIRIRNTACMYDEYRVALGPVKCRGWSIF